MNNSRKVLLLAVFFLSTVVSAVVMAGDGEKDGLFTFLDRLHEKQGVRFLVCGNAQNFTFEGDLPNEDLPALDLISALNFEGSNSWGHNSWGQVTYLKFNLAKKCSQYQCP
jgi:hypothetical protein